MDTITVQLAFNNHYPLSQLCLQTDKGLWAVTEIQLGENGQYIIWSGLCTHQVQPDFLLFTDDEQDEIYS